MTGMRHTPKFMGTILSKVIKSFFIDQVNANNSFHDTTSWPRTSNLKFLKGSVDISSVFDDNDVLSGIIGYDNEMYLCQNVLAKNGGGIRLFNLQFDDTDGGKVYELHYAPVRLGSDAQHIHFDDRRALESFTKEQIMMTKHYKSFDKCNSRPWTVICRNWKVRNSKGRFKLLKESVETYSWVVKWEKHKRNK